MKDGFIKVCAVTPEVKVADVDHNLLRIELLISDAVKAGAKIIVFPELCLSGYSARDIFFAHSLLSACKRALGELVAYCKNYDALVAVGLPFEYNSKLYNVAALIHKGKLLGLVPKKHLPNYQEFYEARQFTKGFDDPVPVKVEGYDCLLGAKQIFVCDSMPYLKVGVEICEDLWTPNPPSTGLAMAGASVILNLSASDELTGKSAYRRQLVADQSARLYCGYVYASAGEDESTTDVVYSGHNIIADSGNVLVESKLFDKGMIMSEIDVENINSKRMRMTTFDMMSDFYRTVHFDLKLSDTEITRYIDPAPFVPSDESKRTQRCEEILDIQSTGLKKRLKHTGAKSAVIGISGGLDSTLALIVTVRAFDMLGLDRAGIIGVTMPGFGTTDRTYDNAVAMIKALGVTFKEISIVESVKAHFSDIEQDLSVHDVTYENGQARMRTMILMDLANKHGGLVIGTGDMSELALGWATYNGDHMSMYAVNAGVPKTLVRHLVAYYADSVGKGKLKKVLYDVLDTPVSPELLPPEEDGTISQKTEDLVGPYELHDFFLYHFMRYGQSPKKIYRLAKMAFAGSEYNEKTILKWEKTFFGRFFSQQYKRSCLPDGPKVGSVCLSPRGDLRMVSDTSSKLWLKELEEID
ncbi:MAG: NAD(+) synthase [Pseudobutyrivibrio sp.]|nr:NAD(+) synthase [Pseudobutyrivibrio sp.]